MKCGLCNKQATHLVHEQLQPHCLEHMLESLGAAPTQVIDIESWEIAQRDIKQTA
jgi:hypothetical protein